MHHKAIFTKDFEKNLNPSEFPIPMYSAAQFGSWLSLVVKRLVLLGCILPVTPVLFCVSNSVQCVCPPPCFFFNLHYLLIYLLAYLLSGTCHGSSLEVREQLVGSTTWTLGP